MSSVNPSAKFQFQRGTIGKPQPGGFSVKKNTGAFGTKFQLGMGEKTRFDKMDYVDRRKFAKDLQKETGMAIATEGREGSAVFKQLQKNLERAERYGRKEIEIPISQPGGPKTGPSPKAGQDDRPVRRAQWF